MGKSWYKAAKELLIRGTVLFVAKGAHANSTSIDPAPGPCPSTSYPDDVPTIHVCAPGAPAPEPLLPGGGLDHFHQHGANAPKGLKPPRFTELGPAPAHNVWRYRVVRIALTAGYTGQGGTATVSVASDSFYALINRQWTAVPADQVSVPLLASDSPDDFLDLAAEPLPPSENITVTRHLERNSFGLTLCEMKAHIIGCGCFRNAEEQILSLAVAGQEGMGMDAHDDSKAGAGLAENFSIYNLSLDMIQRANWTGDLYPEKWNSLERVCIATQILLDYIRGDAPRDIPRSTVDLPLAALGLNFHRGGRSAYLGNTPLNWDKSKNFRDQVELYRRAIVTAMQLHRENPHLMWGNLRVNIFVPHI